MKPTSCLHVSRKLRRRQRGVDEAERPALLRLPRRSDEPAHRGAIKRGGKADAAHAGRLELGDGERFAGYANHEIEGFCDRGARCLHRFEIRQAGRHQHVGARLLVGLQAPDCIVEIDVAAQEALGSRGQQEGESGNK
jgi:hypothetical protein